MKVRKAKGFTLVELLVVISIIAILSVVGITIFSSVQKSARDTRRKADLRAIAGALEIYKNNTGTYPLAATGWRYSTQAQPWIPGLDSTYMPAIPTDPKNSGGTPQSGGYAYAYVAISLYMEVGKYFVLAAHLENPSAADLSTSCLTSPATGGVYRWGGNGNGTGVTTKTNGLNFFVCNQQ